MKEHSSCKTAMETCIAEKYFAVAHLYKEEKAMNMHIHDCYEIYYSISGGKQFLIDNKLYPISPGDIFFINQYESHYLTQIDSEVHERIVLSIHPECLKAHSSAKTDLSTCCSNREEPFSHKISLQREQRSRFLYLVNKILSASGFGQDLLEKAAFLELMLFLNQAFLSACGSDTILLEQEPSLRYNKHADDILNYINQNIHENITLQNLSSNFYLSESYLCRVFKNATGMTINKYITARRISIAKSILADGLSVNQVCEQCGYQDYSNFVKTFTKAVGLSPKKYAQCCTH